jgi:hypothetical protein
VKNEKRLAPASICLTFYGIQFFYRHTVPREWPTLERLAGRGASRGTTSYGGEVPEPLA